MMKSCNGWMRFGSCVAAGMLAFSAASALGDAGNALSFNGTTQYVNIPDANSLDMTNNYTLECWFKADSFGGLRALISKYHSGSANGYLLRLNGTELDFDQMTTSGLNLQAGQWYHVAAVNSNGTRRLYVNGVEKAISGTATVVIANTDPVRLASEFDGRYFAGQLDETRIWNTSRTQAEIQQGMYQTLAGSESGLVAYYQFDQASGTSLPDLTTSANTGTLVNAPVWTASSVPVNYALTFNGTTQYVSIPDANSLDMTNNYTLECWFKADSFGAAGVAGGGLIGKYQTAGANGYLLRLRGTELDFDQMYTSGLNLQSNRWYHVAAVNTNGTRRLYVNGVEKTISGPGLTVVANTDEVRLGCDYRSRYFAGQIDEARIWNIVRTQSEIQDTMHKGLIGSESGLQAYYRFNQGAGTSLTDSTANAHTGTLVNTPTWSASTLPLANVVAGNTNVRGVWIANPTSLASSRLTVTNAVATGTDFAVFGHDNGADAWQTTDVPAFNDRLTRVWRAEVVSSASGDIKIDTTGLSNIVGSRLRLLVDSDGTFASGATSLEGTYSAPYFTVTGQSLTNGNYYTLATLPTYTRTVTYNGNGNDGGTAPVDGSSPYYGSSTVTVLGGGTLTKTGFHVNSWNTAADRSGTEYAVGATFTITTDTTLYAQWTHTVTATAGANGTLDGSTPSPANVLDNATVSFKFNADSGYHVASVTGCGISYSNSSDAVSTYTATTGPITGDGTVTATFALNYFTSSAAGLPLIYSYGMGGASIGDYDRDGKQDILLAGELGGTSTRITRIYRNNGDGTYTDSGISLPGVSEGMVAWGDYDNDGYLDFVMAGTMIAGDGSTRITRIYHNNGNGTFTDINAGLPGLRYSSGAWGDYDNDGRLDLILSGFAYGVSITKIYHNDGNGVFSDSGVSLPGLEQGAVAWADYDNDGKLDFVLTGYKSPNYVARIYRNNGDGTFSDSNAGLPGVKNSSVAWGDYDNDGYLDLGLNGTTNNLADYAAAISRIYRNNGNGTFSDINAGLTGSLKGGCAWGDYDNDGRLDLALSGETATRTSGDPFLLYRNNGDNTFGFIETGLKANLIGSLHPDFAGWSDIDSDGRLDLVLIRGGSPIAGRVFHNNGATTLITPPTAPGSLTAAINNGAVVFSWGAASDGQTPADGLSYNLRVGTAPGTDDIFSGTANTTNGCRYVPALGNMGKKRSQTLTLPQGHTYYWSVQAIDTSYAGGAWAAEASVAVPNLPVITTAGLTNITATGAQGGGNVVSAGDAPVTARGLCWNTSGAPTRADPGTANGSGIGAFTGTLTGLTEGQTYYVRAWAATASDTIYGSQRSFVARAPSTLLPPGNTLVFNGSSQYAEIPSATELGLKDTHTLELWFKPASVTGLQGLVSKYQTSAANGWYLRLNGTEVEFNGQTTAGLGLAAGYWYHLAAVKAGTNQTLYIYGTAVPLTGTKQVISLNTDPVRLGSDFGGSYFNGRMDEVRIWNTARSQQEIRENLHLVQSDTETGLVAYYTFDERSGTALCERAQSAWQHPGTLTGMTGGERVPSTIPAGTGSANSQAEALGTVTFSGVGLTANFTAIDAANYTTTRINAGPPNVAPASNKEQLSPWWSVDRLDASGSFSASFTFTVSQGLTAADEATPANVSLYRRGSVSDTAWTLLGTASSVSVANQTATFDNITSFGQFAVVRSAPLMTRVDTAITGLPGGNVGSGQVNRPLAWGDYNNDGRQDIAMIIDENTTKIFRHNADGSFTDIGVSLPGSKNGNIAWADYDNDGWLDLAIIGNASYKTYVYRNNHNDTFTLAATLDIGCGTGAYHTGNVAWGDYNNDGRPDLLISVDDWNTYPGGVKTAIYRNDGGGVFTDINAGLPRAARSHALWGDFDNDGRLDIVVVDAEKTKIYHNNGPDSGGVYSFTASATVEQANIDFNNVAIGDYDNDGYLDLAITGDFGVHIYHNNGDGSFTDINAGLPYYNKGMNIEWGDYDNDGRLDLLYSTAYNWNSVANKVMVYRNNGNNTFTDITGNLYVNTTPGSFTGYAAWGDYDGDGKLDIAMLQSDATYIYRNTTSSAANTAPTAPGGLSATVSGGVATLSWNASGDSQTPAAGLTYNLRVGTGPGKDDVFSGLANTASGFRKVAALGNVQMNRSWSITLPARATYTWSVQAVDTGLEGGAWATEGSFHDSAPAVDTAFLSAIAATSATCGGEVTDIGDSPVTARGCVWNTNGNPTVASHDGITTDDSGAGSFTSSLTGLTPGQTYYVRAYASNSDGTNYGVQRVFSPAMTPPGNALLFDGTNDYVSIADAASLDVTNNYTLETWFKADSFGSLRALISKYHTSNANGYLLRLTGTDLDFDQLVTTGLNLQAGQWYHVAAVNDNGTRRLYVNGVEKAISGTATTVAANTDPVRLASDFGGRYLAGQMDEARIWNVVRSPADIQDAMHRELTGSESGLVAYYKFNQTSGTLLIDVTGKGHDGTLMNGPTWVASTIPCANAIADLTNLRGTWIANTNSLASSRLSVTNATAAGTDFAVFGHDNTSDAWQTADAPAGVNSRLTRVWRAEVSGSASGTITIDTTGLSDIGDGSTLRLLVDADGTFANSTVVTGTYSAPYFTVAGQTIASGNYYTLGNNIPEFADSGSSIPAATSAWHGAAWGDYNNDGYLDFVLNGLLYRNNGNNTFTDMSASAGLTAVPSGTGAAAWGDFDGDGYLDLALSGNTGSGYITKIYRNNGNGTFTDINAGLPGLNYSSVAWGDYDNDGRPDLLLAGAGSGGNITRIYRNNGDNTFSDSGISLPGITQGHAAWGDHNNDGRLDVVLHGGTATSGNITRIYRNNGDNTFTDISAGLIGDSWGSVAWMDYNNDGKLDLLISGTSGSTNNLLYRNNGGGSFTEMAGTSLGMSQRSSAAWGDFNNDGTPDILISGSPSRSYFYRNNGNDTFTDIVAGLPNALWGGVAMADYDNDGRLDFLFSGGTAILYHNASGVSSNSAPTAPGNLQATRTGNTTFTFTWNAATDSETPADGLSYNLRIGTASGKDDVMPSNSDSNGYRRVAALGNVQMNRTWELTLAPGTTYHWSVQAIDSGLKGGTWGTEQTIVIPNLPVVTTADITTMTTTSAQSGGDITAAGDSAVTARGVCWNSTGTPTLSDTCTTNDSGIGSYTSSLIGLTNGQTYYVRAYATSASGTGYGSQKAFVLHDSSTALTPPGNALVFIGASNQYVQVSHSVELGFTANYTLELWLRADAVTGIQTLVSKGGSGWSLGLNNSEVVFDGLTTSGLGLTTGVWYHLAAINSSGTRSLYVNGVATTLIGTATTVQYNIDAVTIGSGSGTFSGRMDELRIWNVARSEQEVRENMHLVPGGSKTGMIAWYDFDETSDTALYDRSQSAILHNGTLTNMVGTEWNRSTIPAGSGSANSQTEVETDTITFSGTDLLAYFTTAGTASLTATRINADMPRGTWPANLAVFSPWYVVERFGSGSFSATLTITVSQGMDATDEASPSGVGLYRRDATSEGAWTLVTTASSVDAATQTAVFPNVTSFGQLAVGHTVMRKQATTLPGTGYGECEALAWGDFDNDGKLDLAFTTGSSSGIYRNNGNGTFSDISAGLPVPSDGSAVAWADYNGDGYLDLALGITSGTYIYRNNGNNTFTGVATLSPGTRNLNQTLIWGDYNNDGRPDLLVIGYASGSNGVTRLYRNDGNDTFTDSGVSFPDNSFAGAAWGDYDNDGYLDLVVSGGAGAFIYHNNGNGTFTNIGANGLVGGMSGRVAWGDYDNDGWLDLVLGKAQYINIYHNNHNGTFTDIGFNPATFSRRAHVAWGDYDNDGRLDLLAMGDFYGAMNGTKSTLFHNNGQGSFTDLGINFYGGAGGMIYAAFGDYDNDGRLDVAVLGTDATEVWRNYSVTVNTAPTAPTGLSAGVTNGVATLSWNAATDSQTPASGLTYNLRVGTAPGKDDVMSSMANTTSGLRKVPAIGNVNMNRSWTINLPASGTYYWSVQAVDTALAGGVWGAESSFSATLDADGDTLPNEWEATYYGGTTNANPDALAANGVNTLREAYIADLNPTNPASYFRITAVSNLPPWTVYFEASAGRAYTLIGVSNLVSGVWTNIPGAGPRLGIGGQDSLSDTNVPPKGPFYKLRVELP